MKNSLTSVVFNQALDNKVVSRPKVCRKAYTA